MTSLRQALTSGLSDRPHPLYAGAVVLVMRDGSVEAHEAVGHALRYADGDGTLLPDARQLRDAA